MNNETKTRPVIDMTARNFVRPAEIVHQPQRQAPVLPESSSTLYAIEAKPVAEQHMTVTTSATDRAIGYLLETLPLYACFGLGVTLISVYFWHVPLLSITALIIYWLTFVCAWLVSYIVHKFLSVEGVAFYEASQKWKVIKREQEKRWQYYERG
jgi:hypothetical protein